MAVEQVSLLRLRVVAEDDPGALQRVLGYFQNLNFLPRRVIAEFGSNRTIHIEVDTVGLSESRLSVIAAKLGEAPCVLRAHWHRV